MKIIKNITIGVMLAGMLSCDNGFEDINRNPNSPAGSRSWQLLTNAQFKFSENIGDEWNSGRMGMYYAQYWSSTYYSEESRFQIRETNNQIMWNTFYADALAELKDAQTIEAMEKAAGYENRIAIVEIMKALVFHNISDIYGGPVPFTEALSSDNITPKYNTGEEVYLGLLNTLEAQVKVLDEHKPGFAIGDVIYGGDVARWKRFANSLRLRIALRMIDAKPAEASEAIRKSLDPANGGIIRSEQESASFVWQPVAPNNNPLNENAKTRTDFSMSKNFVDYLKLYADPRLPVFARPLLGTKDTFEGEVYGLKNGNGSSNGDESEVSLPADYAMSAQAPTIWLDFVEVKFMLAEIAARGLQVGLTGTAEQYYQEGVKGSMQLAGITDVAVVENYLKRVPFTPLKWKDCIGSQKWIGMYTQGIQAWLERLRLDFKDPNTGKAIFSAPADGSLDRDVKEVSARMSYPVTEASLNATNYRAAIGILGGVNSKAAKNWWDKF